MRGVLYEYLKDFKLLGKTRHNCSRFLLTLGIVTLWLGHQMAVAGQPTSRDGALADCKLAIAAQQALLQDKTLGSINLGVSVRWAVATLWGSISSAELSQSAEQLVRQVPGVTAVRNELRIEPPSELGFNLFTQVAPKTRVPPAEHGPLENIHSSSGALTSRPEKIARKTDPGAFERIFDSQPVPNLRLLPPIAIDPAPQKAEITTSPTSLPVITSTHLASQVNRMRMANPRFADIRFQVTDRVVTLISSVQNGTLFEFARVVSHLPGVDHVLIQSAIGSATQSPGLR